MSKSTSRSGTIKNYKRNVDAETPIQIVAHVQGVPSRTTSFMCTNRTLERLRLLVSQQIHPRDRFVRQLSKKSGKMTLSERAGSGRSRAPDNKLVRLSLPLKSRIRLIAIQPQISAWEESLELFFLNYGKRKKELKAKSKKMRKKIPNAETLESGENTDIDISLSNKAELKRYLNKVDMLNSIPDEQKELYKYIRKTLQIGLSDRHNRDVIFAVLIERIARTAVLMDIMERHMIQMIVPATTISESQFTKSEYNVLQTEHRKCVEAFTNLRFAYDQKKKITTLERLRQEIG